MQWLPYLTFYAGTIFAFLASMLIGYHDRFYSLPSWRDLMAITLSCILWPVLAIINVTVKIINR